jgi:hypothetical protein
LTDFNLNFGHATESLIPILATVEFDIDRRSRAGGWYEPLRVQRAAKYRQQQAEREASKPIKKKKFILPPKRDTLSERERTMAEEIARLRALVANSSMASRSSVRDSDYAPLDDNSAENGSEYDSGSDIDETEVLPTSIVSNPVEKLFSDETALRDIRRAKRETNSHLDTIPRLLPAIDMPKLKLDGAALMEVDEVDETEISQVQEDEKEIISLWNSNNRPTLNILNQPSGPDPNPTPDQSTSPPKRLAQRPPPLDLSGSINRAAQLQTPTPISRASESTSASSARLPYLSSPGEAQGSLPPSRAVNRQTSEDSSIANEVGTRLSTMEDQVAFFCFTRLV